MPTIKIKEEIFKLRIVAIGAGGAVFDGGTVAGATTFLALVTFNTPPTSPVAGQTDSQAWGPGATVTGIRALAFGDGASAVEESLAIGTDANAGGSNTNIAIGTNAETTPGAAPHTLSNQSIAIGTFNRMKGPANVSIGTFGDHEMTRGVYIGFGGIAQGTSIVSVGAGSVIGLGGDADRSINLGDANTIADTHRDCIAIGQGVITTGPNQGHWGTATRPVNLRLHAGIGEFGSAPPASQPAAIPNPAGGGTIDSEARTAINAILAVLRARGTINT